MQIGEMEYDSTGHFERLAELLPWTIADMAVDGMADRLINAERGTGILTRLGERLPAGRIKEHRHYRDVGTIVAHIDRVWGTKVTQHARVVITHRISS